MECVGILKILACFCQSTESHIAEGRDILRIHRRDNVAAEKLLLFAEHMPKVNLTVQLQESLRSS
jgi:hypothetical protein